MTVKSHNKSWYTGDVLAYKGFSGQILGAAKALKEIWLEEASSYYFIMQHGKIEDNKFVPSAGGRTLSIYTADQASNEYDLKWTPDTLAPVMGDLLSGKDANGKDVILFFENANSVHRLTPMNTANTPGSSASLDFYQRKLTDLKVLKDLNWAKPFSQLR
jgi:hypothetical protein